MEKENKREEKVFYAHTSSHGNEPLEDHLRLVGDLAETFGADFESSKITKTIGNVHDIGKRTVKFSRVLERMESKVNHAIVGAEYLHNECFLENEKRRYIEDRMMHLIICAAIKGHHSRMGESFSRKYDLEEMYQLPEADEFDMPDGDGKVNALSSLKEYEAVAQYAEDNKLVGHIEKTDYLPLEIMDEYAKMLYARMIFSSLVDADYTATAKFCDDIELEEDKILNADKCIGDLNAYRNKILANADPSLEINRLRNKVYNDAEAAGKLGRGFYSMTAPTGTAKTLALMRFALEQAKVNGYKRIFVVLPYLSIISQNADVYRKAFGNNIVFEDDSDTKYNEAAQRMVDRWNAPIIITTSVKFFETLFTDYAAPSRKLHQIANSAVVFDECQVLPHDLTSCTIMTLKALVDHFNVSVLLSTATFPKYQYRREIPDGFQMTEVIKNVKTLYCDYDKIKKTKIIVRKEEIDFQDLREYAQDKKQVLFVFNTVGKALSMYKILKDVKEGSIVFYLSSDLCTEHKKTVIRKVKAMLDQGQECYLVSTQCIEAGVDIDFPTGVREYAPLSSIIQTAGRINRNGKRYGEFVIFMLKDTNVYGFPSSAYYTEACRTRALAERHQELNLNDIELMDEYYSELYGQDTSTGADRSEIREACKKLDVKKICDEYKLIDSTGQCTVIVPYAAKREEFESLLKTIRAQDYCITRKQMALCPDFRVNRYMNGKKAEFIKMHCHQLHVRLGRNREKVGIDWYIADIDEIYDEKTGLQREEMSEAYML